MIPMKCPSCGRKGSIPPNRLNTRMHCKKCDAVFHMDPSGRVVLGEPGGREKRATRREERAKNEPLDPIGYLAKSKTFRRVLVVAGAVLLVAVIVQAAMSLNPPVPLDLAERTDYVGQMFAEERLGRLKALAVPSTRDDLVAWYEKTRPAFLFKGPQGPGNMVLITVAQVTADTAAGAAQTYATLIAPPRPDLFPPKPATDASAKPGGDSGEFVLNLFWATEPGSGEQWLLDGSKILAESNKSAEAAKKKK
jgi:hypothetical protein